MPEYLSVQTHTRVEMVDVTTALGNVLSSNVPKGWIDGFLVVYSPHTTCGVTINEGWDPDVKRDMMDLFSKYIPKDGGFRHAEGNADAHIKTSIYGASVMVPVAAGRLDLGQWQSVYLCESDGPRIRKLRISFVKAE